MASNLPQSEPGTSAGEASPAPLATLHGQPDSGVFQVLRDVEVEVTLEIGRKRMKIADVLRLKSGQTFDLAKAAGEPLEIYVNGQILGRGEAVVVGDRYGVRITELVGAPPVEKAP